MTEDSLYQQIKARYEAVQDDMRVPGGWSADEYRIKQQYRTDIPLLLRALELLGKSHYEGTGLLFYPDYWLQEAKKGMK
jgi:hypothetical protein